MLWFMRTCGAGLVLRLHRCNLSIAGVLSLALALFAGARVAAETTSAAVTTAAARQDASAAVPWDELTDESRARLSDIISRATIYRQLPTEAVKCDPEMYLHLVRNPDVVVNIWHLMDVTDMTMRRTGAFSFDSDDKAGTTSTIELVYGTPKLHIYAARTHYEGPMFARPVDAEVVLLLRSEYAAGADGRTEVTSTMDAFIRIDHVAAKLVARTLSSLIGRTADHNFGESMRFVARVSKTAEDNLQGMQELSDRLSELQPAARKQFSQVCGTVAQREVARHAARGTGAAKIDMVEHHVQTPGQTPSAAASQPTSSIPRRPLQLRR
jgi:hypothetical protein